MSNLLKESISVGAIVGLALILIVCIAVVVARNSSSPLCYRTESTPLHTIHIDVRGLPMVCEQEDLATGKIEILCREMDSCLKERMGK